MPAARAPAPQSCSRTSPTGGVRTTGCSSCSTPAPRQSPSQSRTAKARTPPSSTTTYLCPHGIRLTPCPSGDIWPPYAPQARATSSPAGIVSSNPSPPMQGRNCTAYSIATPCAAPPTAASGTAATSATSPTTATSVTSTTTLGAAPARSTLEPSSSTWEPTYTSTTAPQPCP